jgi:hypothetical protein
MGKGDFKRRIRRKEVTINLSLAKGFRSQIDQKIERKGELPMSAKKEKQKTEEKEVKKSRNKEKPLRAVGLVVIPEAVMEEQSKEVQELLKQLNVLKDRSSSEGAKIRKALRKAGFKLSNFRRRSSELRK